MTSVGAHGAGVVLRKLKIMHLGHVRGLFRGIRSSAVVLRVSLFGLCLLVLSGCSFEISPLLNPPSSMKASSSEAETAARLISRYRAAHGLGPVAVSARLNSAAEHQARAVAATGILSHGEFTSRMAAYGIKGYRAENLAAGSDAVEDVIARWKASSGHNRNMLLPQVTMVGLARVDTPGSGWGRYWALVLSSEQ
jgi:uncharacterized protein YkwD